MEYPVECYRCRKTVVVELASEELHAFELMREEELISEFVAIRVFEGMDTKTKLMVSREMCDACLVNSLVESGNACEELYTSGLKYAEDLHYSAREAERASEELGRRFEAAQALLSAVLNNTRI